MSDSHLYSSSTDIQNRDVILTREIYVHRRGPFSVNNTQHVSPKIYLHLPLPSNQGGTMKSSSPFTRRRGHIGDGGWSLGHQSTSIIHLNTRNKSKTHTRSLPLSFVDFFFFCQGFEWFCLDKRLVHLQKHTLVFFSLSDLYIYIIRYGSLSQFVLQHHTGERGWGVDGWRREALIKVE